MRTESHDTSKEAASERLHVVKIGGNIIDHADQLDRFLTDFAGLEGKKILVHGGGKIATAMGEKLGIVSRYENGRRITDADTIDLVTMVYGGLINKKMVAALQRLGCDAIGLTGADGNMIPAVRRPVTDVDFGFVGDVVSDRMDGGRVKGLLDLGLVPVFAPLTHDGQGQMLNTNADTIASVLGIALAAYYQVRLIYCFDKKGVLRSLDDENDVVHLMDHAVYQGLLAAGVLHDGILPKLENAFDAITRGVGEVVIGQASDLKANVTGQVAGTLIRA